MCTLKNMYYTINRNGKEIMKWEEKIVQKVRNTKVKEMYVLENKAE